MTIHKTRLWLRGLQMNKDETYLVGLLLKNAAICICQNMPTREIQNHDWPYPDFQMKAEKGARFSVFYSAGNVAEKIFKELRFAKALNQYRNFEFTIDASDFTEVISNDKKLPHDLLNRTIASHLLLIDQFPTFPESYGEYHKIMQGFEKLEYAEFKQISESELKSWYEVRYDALQLAARMMRKSTESLSGPRTDIARKMLEIFDKEHGTDNGKIWHWTERMKSYF